MNRAPDRQHLDRQHLANTRAVLRGRAGRPTTANNAYKIYELLLLALVVIFPLARAIMVGLAVPEVATVAAERLTLATLTPALLSAAGGLVLLGHLRGPVVPSAAYINLVAAGPLSRAETLRRPFTQGRVALVVLSVFGGTILAGGAFFTGPISLLGAGLFLGATALGAWQISLLWLVGQLSLPIRRVTLAVLCGLLGVVLVLTVIPATTQIAGWLGPWGWVSHVWASVQGGVTPATWIGVTALVLGLGAAVCTTRLLTLLSLADLEVQAQRWGTVATLVATGDVKSAMNRLKTFPRIGRRWQVAFPGRPILAVIVRDLVGLARFPVRALFWAVTTVASGAVLAYAFVAAPGGLLLALAAPVLMYFAVGGWADGLRFHASTIGASSSFGVAPGRLAVLHLVVPTIAAEVCVLIGVLITVALQPSLALGLVLSWSAALVAFLVVMQAFSAVKGMLPLELLTPVPTPMGDLSYLSVAFWLADAVIIVLLVAGGLSFLMIDATSSMNPFGLLGCAAALMVFWSLARFHTLARP